MTAASVTLALSAQQVEDGFVDAINACYVEQASAMLEAVHKTDKTAVPESLMVAVRELQQDYRNRLASVVDAIQAAMPTAGSRATP